jgi:lactoylglutathione lyase
LLNSGAKLAIRQTAQAGGENIMKHEGGAIAVGHIALNVSDIEISVAFYQEVLGMRVASESLEFPFKYASMAWDGKTVLTLWEQSGGRFKKRRPGLHHLAFEADSVKELDRTKGLLENLGAPWSEGAKLYAEESRSAAIHFKDPDGIRIELYTVDRKDTPLQEQKGIPLAPEVNELCVQ